ncbi:hypothetical protein [Mucilaginibacter flavus]|uniref:hypothetical protein n=1 Tax=Mucilaginibacter flavus TaxID=931504 RepID=UPI0025B4D6A9|nr:hypothetical protein [Mucilaginibacter flavus]MDN3579364.1 hypothetical protein [Mucilaginibacter flavus]
MILPSFLHIADSSIGLSLDSSKRESLKAHIKHSLLFEERLLLTDSQLIDNKNLRFLLFEDKEFSSLFSKDNLSIALRNVIDIRQSSSELPSEYIYDPTIDEIVKGFISWKKCSWENSSNINVQKRYAQTIELDNLTKSVNIERYSLGSVGAMFTDDMLDVLSRGNVMDKIGEKFANQVSDLVIEKRLKQSGEINPRGGVGIAYFKNELGAELFNRGFAKEWKQNEKFILDISQAPYLTALPKVFNANPIYGAMHKPHIDIMNGKSEIKVIGKDEYYRTNLLQYETGINLLSVKSIEKLRNSDRFRKFRDSLNRYDGTESGLRTAMFSFDEYKIAIDDEILKCFPFLKERRTINREIMRPAELLYDAPNYGGVMLSTLSIFSVSFTGMNPLSLGLGLLGLIGAKIFSGLKERTEHRTDFEKRILIDKLEKDKSNKITGEYNVVSNEDDFRKSTHTVMLSSVV